MKRVLPIFVTLLAAVSFASAESATIRVKGMVCESCSEAVTTKLKADPGVETVVVNVRKGLVDVTLKQSAKVEDQTLKTLIADAGYTVIDISRKE